MIMITIGTYSAESAQALSAYTFFKCTCFQDWMYTIERERERERLGQVFKDDLKEVTKIGWRTETGSWFHLFGTLNQAVLFMMNYVLLWNTSWAHFKMVATRTESPICAPSQCCPYNSYNVGLIACRWPFLVFWTKVIERFLFLGPSAPCDQLRKSLALRVQMVSRAPQHFRSSKTQATCDSCFAR